MSQLLTAKNVKTIVVTCEDPTLMNGQVNPTGQSSANTTVSFMCHSGYNLQGSTSSTCQNSGTWVPPLPTCLEGNEVIMYISVFLALNIQFTLTLEPGKWFWVVLGDFYSTGRHYFMTSALGLCLAYALFDGGNALRGKQNRLRGHNCYLINLVLTVN